MSCPAGAPLRLRLRTGSRRSTLCLEEKGVVGAKAVGGLVVQSQSEGGSDCEELRRFDARLENFLRTRSRRTGPSWSNFMLRGWRSHKGDESMAAALRSDLLDPVWVCRFLVDL
ncbi:hypothetical protein ACLB2K_022932 [Fragaria x ananassa]